MDVQPCRYRFQPDGILSALIEDLDEDEGLEMLVLAIEDPAAEQYEGRPVDLAYAQSAKNVMGTVYEIADGEVQAGGRYRPDPGVQ